jgi:hypothetical protein
MRTTALGVCVTCLLLSTLSHTTAAPASTDDPTLRNIEALTASRTDGKAGIIISMTTNTSPAARLSDRRLLIRAAAPMNRCGCGVRMGRRWCDASGVAISRIYCGGRWRSR